MIAMNNEKIYYNYVYLDPRKPGKYIYDDYVFDYEPFYVGKGKNERKHEHVEYILSHDNFKNTCKNNIIKAILSVNLEPIIIEYYSNLTEQEAFDNEIKMIRIIGTSRRISSHDEIRKGPLANRQAGGLGGAIHWTDEARANRSKISRKIWSDDDLRKRHSERMKGINTWSKGCKMNEESRKKMGESHKGSKMSEENKKRASIRMTGINNPNKDGHTFLGKKHTEETKRKLSKIHKGKIIKEETKKKISEFQLKQYNAYFIFTSPADIEYLVYRDASNHYENFMLFLKENRISKRALIDIGYNGIIRSRATRFKSDEYKWKIRLATEEEIENFNITRKADNDE